LTADPVYIPDVTVRAATAKALLCATGGVEFWVPRALCRLGTTVSKAGDVGWLAVPASFAAKKKIKRLTI